MPTLIWSLVWQWPQEAEGWVKVCQEAETCKCRECRWAWLGLGLTGGGQEPWPSPGGNNVHQGVRPGGLRRVWHLQGLSSSQACWKALGTDLGQNRSGLKG